tara:strand:+ start:281 stop:1312 length:1032 start_codon:yes stop_codon:yes gene_type:complete
MSVKPIPNDHPKWKNLSDTGVLLVNLGTPDATDKKSMRRYLKEFLSDTRVIEYPKFIWWFILNLIILNVRPKKSGDAYKKIWIPNDPDGSPLRKFTRLQSEKLQKLFKNNKHLIIDWAMRYGNPSISEKLNNFKEIGIKKIVILPLYPQYSAATTATVCDEVYRWALKQRWQPSFRIVPPWFDHPEYISAIAKQIKKSLNNKKNFHLMLSFHGIPKRYFINGDPYHCHCMKTARLIKEKIKYNDSLFHVTFQSRFGSEPWLQPYTDETIQSLAKKGVKKLAIIAPGFFSDCLETLEELAMEGKEIFIDNGGKEFVYIPCLNDSDNSLKIVKKITDENIAGWKI